MRSRSEASDPARRGAPRVDEANQCVWWADQRVDLTPKAFLVLRCLMQRPNEIVSKNDLLEAAWPETHVMDGVLKVAINQLRDAFGDDTQQPRFIETLHRRGYRWIGTSEAPVAAAAELPPLVGREPILAQLEQALARAAAGSRQVVFVTGDPGIGKSAVLDAFAAQLTSGRTGAVGRVLLAQGQCVDGYGTSDAFMPLLQAVAQLCRPSVGEDTVAQLRRFAPTWLVQLPTLLDSDEQDELRRSLAGSTGERMVHDLSCFVEELTARRTLVLLLEDLHWSDHATVAALAALCSRRGPAHLMIVATWRPVDAIAQMHPIVRLKHELTSKRQCQEIALEGLPLEAVGAYLARRFPNHRLPVELPGLLQQQTSGNPLFMLNAVEDFVQRGRLQERAGAWESTVDLATLADAVPESTREMIGYRLQQLSSRDLELLEGASVIGQEFPTQALAAVLEREPAEVEMECGRLARSMRFLDEGEMVSWLDGQAGVQYAFRHALYQQVLYSGVTPARRQILHRRFAETLERGFAAESTEVASQLSHHFERGGELLRAVEYREKAATRALNRFAYLQAIEHLRAGLGILRSLPPGAERDALELTLQAALLAPVYFIAGSQSGELMEVIERIHSLSQDAGPFSYELFRAFASLASAHCFRGEMQAARSVSEELVEHAADGLFTTVATGILGFCQLLQGEIEAGTHKLEGSSGLPEIPAPLDAGIIATSDGAFGRLLLGYPSQVPDRIGDATRRAAALQQPATIEHVARGGIRAGAVLLDDRLVEESATVLDSLPKHNWERLLAWSEIGAGWLEIRHGDYEGADRILRGKERLLGIGYRVMQPLFAAMATAGLLRAGRFDESGALLDHELTMIDETGERWCEAELHRLRGELRFALAAQQRPSTDPRESLLGEAEACFRHALGIARAQGAKWWELRSAVSLARLLGDSGRSSEAHRLLSEAHGGFTEGFDLPDLREARDLLTSLRA